jgi:hypothetical protein
VIDGELVHELKPRTSSSSWTTPASSAAAAIGGELVRGSKLGRGGDRPRPCARALASELELDQEHAGESYGGGDQLDTELLM